MARAGLVGPLLVLARLLAPAPTLAAATVDSVGFTVYACPASIQTPTDLANAGGADAACAVAGKPGDFGPLEPGFTWAIDPIEYDLQASLAASDGSTLTSPDATAGGSCNVTTMICHAFQAYGWFGVPAGKMTLTLDTIPAGYAFGWAEIQVDGKAGRGTVNTATASVTLRAHPHISSVYLRLITIVP